MLYQSLFPGKRWDNLLIKTCKLLQKEPVLITGLPFIGLTTFMRYIEKEYKKYTSEKKIILISLNAITEHEDIENVERKILNKINYELNYPSFLSKLNCEETIIELMKRKYNLVILIDRFQNLRKNKEIIDFLQSVRSLDLYKIRFLINCDLSCLAKPKDFIKAGALISANQLIIPTFTQREVREALGNYKKLFDWDIDIKQSDLVYEYSGGIIGLIKYIAKYIAQNPTKEINMTNLINYQIINFKVRGIFEKLKEYNLIKNGKLNMGKSSLLIQLGILNKNHKLKIHLLKSLIGNNLRKSKSHVSIYEKHLSTQEYNVFMLLQEKKDKIIGLDEISQVLWKEKEREKYSLWSIYKVISNLNKKIKEYGYRIKNYRGRGYGLIKL